ncbi:MAG: phosphate ABC transporter substrate-binding protein [Candidatus Coatesbacteria bacterium]|nr:MAG: phosphate ABC transporter substrate-binding protein [Candidatus Coatesbacteria bacterium]
MKLRVYNLITISALIVLTTIYGCKKKDTTEISIQGSTTVLPIVQRVAEVYMSKNPDVSLSVSGGGSGVGITALLDGTTDIAMASRQMKDKEKATANKKGMKIKEVEIAMDGIAVIVHPSNSISEMTIDDIKSIYMEGGVSNWSKFGGEDKDIVVVSRDTASGTFEVFEKKVLGGEKVRADALLQASNVAVKNAVAGSEGAIGYMGIGYLGDEVKALLVNGVEPTEANVLSGEYPVARKLYLYIRGDAPDDINAFVNFVLSEDGQRIVREVGYIPLK